jgi:hypothetical protein
MPIPVRNSLSAIPWQSGLVALLLVVMAGSLYERVVPLVAGNDFEFPPGFSGPYCLIIEPGAAEASENPEGYLVYRFDSRGISRSSTFPRGAGSITRAFAPAGGASGARSPLNESSSGTWALGDTTLVMGRIGVSSCKPIQNVQPTRAQVLPAQCGIAG